MPGSLSAARRDGIDSGILLSDIVTHTSCHQGRPQHPFDKQQTLFLLQLCLAKLGLELVKKEQSTRVCAKNTPVLLLSETTKTENGFLNIARTQIVRLSGSLSLTRRPPSCWRRAPLGVWIPQPSSGTLCFGYLIGHA